MQAIIAISDNTCILAICRCSMYVYNLMCVHTYMLSLHIDYIQYVHIMNHDSGFIIGIARKIR